LLVSNFYVNPRHLERGTGPDSSTRSGGTRQACQTLAWNLRRWKMIFWSHPRMGTSTASLAYAGGLPRLRIPQQMLRGDSHIVSFGFRPAASKYCSIKYISIGAGKWNFIFQVAAISGKHTTSTRSNITIKSLK
jgi:hypothetical protein